MKTRKVSSSGMSASQRSTEANIERSKRVIENKPIGGTPKQEYFPNVQAQEQVVKTVDTPTSTKPSKVVKKNGKKPKKPLTAGGIVLRIFLVIILLACSLAGAYWYIKIYVPPKIELAYDLSGRKGLDTLESAMQEYSKDDIKSSLVDEPSWLAKEEAYANENKKRIDFIKTVISNVEFSYPREQAVNSRGLMFDKLTGEPLFTDSSMLSGESTFVSHIDYSSISSQMMLDREKILKMVSEKKYLTTDYTYKDEITDLMVEYILGMDKLPMRISEVDIGVENIPIDITDKKGNVSKADNYVVSDDISLDKLLFSSDSFHNMCDTFSTLVSGGIPEKEVIGHDVRSVTMKVNKESIIPYTWVGSYYCKNELGNLVVEEQIGDGTFERPAHMGTTVITKSVDASGNSVDIKITLDKYLVNKEAIDFITGFSEKNRGFVPASNTKLICVEYTVQNLMTVPITVNDDICLADKNANQSAKTGNIYGLTETVTLQPMESKKLQSWASSTELERKYVVWGKSFNRTYPVVWFYLLAGDKDFDKSVLYGEKGKEASSKTKEADNLDNTQE